MDQGGLACGPGGALPDGRSVSARVDESTAGELVFQAGDLGQEDERRRADGDSAGGRAAGADFSCAGDRRGFSHAGGRGAGQAGIVCARVAGSESGDAGSLAAGYVSGGGAGDQRDGPSQAEGCGAAAGAQPGDEDRRQVPGPDSGAAGGVPDAGTGGADPERWAQRIDRGSADSGAGGRSGDATELYTAGELRVLQPLCRVSDGYCAHPRHVPHGAISVHSGAGDAAGRADRAGAEYAAVVS